MVNSRKVKNIKIRKYQKKDRPAIIKVIVSCLTQLFNCSQKKLEKDKWFTDLDDIKKTYFDKGGYFWVAEVNGKIIGTAGLIPISKTTVQFKRLYLLKKYRGQNIGSKLFDKRLNWAKRKSYKKVILHTYKHFKQAHFLFHKRGFKQYKETKDRIFFRKKL